MIVELNDSIQKSQVKTQTQIPAKVQKQTQAPVQAQKKPQTEVSAKTQDQHKSQTLVHSQDKASFQAKEKNTVQSQTQVKAQTQMPAKVQEQVPANDQSSSKTKYLFPVLESDSIQKAQVAAKDSIQKAQKDSIASHTMPLFYKEEFIPGDSIKWTSLGHQPSGFDGISMPYRLRTDDGITGLMLLCFILTAYVFANGRKAIIEQAKNLFSRKDTTDFLGRSTASELRHRIMLRFQTCILLGIFTFNYFHDYNPSSFDQKSIYCVLGIYIGICIVFYSLKRIIYGFLGWVFFDKNTTSAWLESYSTIINYLGICFFPLVLLMVYFNLSASIILIIGFILVIFAKLLMFYKWLKFFFNNLHGLLYLIVYFCALEILPCILLVQGIIQTNIILQLKTLGF